MNIESAGTRENEIKSLTNQKLFGVSVECRLWWNWYLNKVFSCVSDHKLMLISAVAVDRISRRQTNHFIDSQCIALMPNSMYNLSINNPPWRLPELAF